MWKFWKRADSTANKIEELEKEVSRLKRRVSELEQPQFKTSLYTTEYGKYGGYHKRRTLPMQEVIEILLKHTKCELTYSPAKAESFTLVPVKE